jgi:hypothetical protein
MITITTNNDLSTSKLVINNFPLISLITIAIGKQPIIIDNFKKISEMDVKQLQQKVKQFMNDAEQFNDPFYVIITVFLCNLMYKNDIIPKIVHKTLVELGVTDVTVRELKQTSNNLINLLTSSVKSGGGFFSTVGHLFNIGVVFFTIFADYTFVNNTAEVINKNYNQALSIYEKVSGIKGHYDNCNVYVPDSIKIFDKLDEGKYKYEEIYKILNCVGYGYFNDYLKQNPDFIKDDINDFRKEFVETTSNALVPVGHMKSNIDQELFSKELVILEKYQNTANEILESMLIYEDNDKTKLNIEQTIGRLTMYANMDPGRFSSQFKVLVNYEDRTNDFKSQKKEKKEDNSLLNVNDWLSIGKDAINAAYKLIEMAKQQVGPVAAIDVFDQYIYMMQNFLRNNIRKLQDFQLKTTRDIEDFITDVNRLQRDVSKLIQQIQLLMFYNIAAVSIIFYYLRIIFSKFMTEFRKELTLMLPPNNNVNQLQIDNKTPREIVIKRPNAETDKLPVPWITHNTGNKYKPESHIGDIDGGPESHIGDIDGGYKRKKTRSTKKRKPKRIIHRKKHNTNKRKRRYNSRKRH